MTTQGLAMADGSLWPRSSRRMGFGLLLPMGEGSAFGPKPPGFGDIVAMCQAAEEAGFDIAWFIDHFVFRQGENDERGIWECWTMMAAAAARTERIGIGSLVACTGFRNAGVIAKMTEAIDEISGGRFVLGLGAGWHEPEYKAFGYPFENLVSRFEEALQIIHPLLHQGKVDFRGKYYAAERCELMPRGPRRNGPPIMIGARADRPRALRLTAQYADYWHGWYRPQTIAATLAALDAACLKAGRDPATLRRTVTLLVDLPGATGQPTGEWIRRIRAGLGDPFIGTPEQLAALLRSLAANGISHVQLMLEPNSIGAIDALRPALELLDQG